MGKIIKVEVLIATPPTSKCEETIANLEELVRRYPEEVRLVVFRRGIDFTPPELRPVEFQSADYTPPKEVSVQMRTLINKGRGVPSCVIDGELFSAFEVPNLEALEAKVQNILLNAAAKEEAGR